jgi:hypothetical protein
VLLMSGFLMNMLVVQYSDYTAASYEEMEELRKQVMCPHRVMLYCVVLHFIIKPLRVYIISVSLIFFIII